MSDGFPMSFEWSGDAMVPLARHHNEANAHFVIGQVYRLCEFEDRSMNSHRHEFAWLREAWKNLPEDLAPLFPTVESLRKRALIEGGFFYEKIVEARSPAEARNIAALVESLDEFAYVKIDGNVVITRRAMSQRMRGKYAMDRKTFQDSKTAVLRIVSDLIGVTPETLTRNAEKAA